MLKYFFEKNANYIHPDLLSKSEVSLAGQELGLELTDNQSKQHVYDLLMRIAEVEANEKGLLLTEDIVDLLMLDPNSTGESRFFNCLRRIAAVDAEEQGVFISDELFEIEFSYLEYLREKQNLVTDLVTQKYIETMIGKISYETLDPTTLLMLCKPFLQGPVLFDWIYICVTVVPLFLFSYMVFAIIYSSYISSRAANRLKDQKYDLTLTELSYTKEDIFFEITVLNIKRALRILKFLLILEIINPINWTKNIELFGGFLISTPIISFFVCLVLIFAFLGFKLILDIVVRLKIIAVDLAVILLFMVFFLLLMLYSNHFIPFYFGIEGTALSTCVALVLLFDSKNSFDQVKILWSEKLGFKSKLKTVSFKYSTLLENWKLQKKLNQEAVAAGMMYFLLNIFVTIVLAFIFFFLILNFNTLSFFSLFNIFLSISNADFEIGMLIIFFLIIFSFKLGITPFHFWLPGVFSGANYGILFFLAIPVKIVFSFFLFKFFFTFFNPFFYIWGPMFLFLGLLSIFVGSVGLYYENQIKRFFAYSTINHFGNMFLAFGMGNFIGQNAFLIYFFSYILMNVFFLNYVSSLTNSVTQKTIFSFSEINNIRFTNTISQIGFACTLLSMIGLPPFVGFWGKMLVLKSVLFTPTLLGFLLALFVVITSVIAAKSYLGVIKTLFISSYKNLQLSQLYPFSFFIIKSLCLFFIIISAGFLIQFVPNIFFHFDLFIIAFLHTEYINFF